MTAIPSPPKWTAAELEQAVLPVLVRSFPRAFFPRGKTCGPLRVGIFGDLDAVLAPEFDKGILKRYLSYYVSASRYLREIVAGVVRIDLCRMPTGFVTEAQANFAARKWQGLYGRKPSQPHKVPSPAEAPKAAADQSEGTPQAWLAAKIGPAPLPRF